MPRYIYKCNDCGRQFLVTHSVDEEETICAYCGTEGKLFRVPSMLNTQKKTSKKKKVGNVVDKFIKETKNEIELDKDSLRKREYKDV